MKKDLLLMLALLACTAISMAQVAAEPASPNALGQGTEPKAPNSAPPAASALPSGTVLAVDLSKSLDAKKSKGGDKIEARTAADMLAHGQILVPRNTKIIGHVTQAKARSKESPDSMVGITFDRMLLKDGREVPLQLMVQAIARPLQISPGLSSTPADTPAGTAPPMLGRASMGGAPGAGGASSYPAGDQGAGLDPMASSSSTSTPLSPSSRGVVGMRGLSLDAAGPVAVLSSNTGNVHLDGGTQLILRVQ
jgi:hypothetical protein